MCVVISVTGVGVLLILARSVAQALTDPYLVTNKENPEGATVSISRWFTTNCASNETAMTCSKYLCGSQAIEHGTCRYITAVLLSMPVLTRSHTTEGLFT